MTFIKAEILKNGFSMGKMDHSPTNGWFVGLKHINHKCSQNKILAVSVFTLLSSVVLDIATIDFRNNLTPIMSHL